MSAFMTAVKGWNWKKIGIIAGIVVGALALIYVIFSIYFMSHYFFRSTVNGVPSSGKSASAMVAAIKDAAGNYTLDIIDEDKTTMTVASPDIDLNVDVTEDKLSSLFDDQNGFAWIKYVFTDKEYVTQSIISLNSDKLNDKLKSLKCMNREATNPTENAKIDFDKNQDAFVIKSEVYGDTVELNDLSLKVTDAIYKFKKSFDIVNDKGYVQPTVLSSDATLNKSLQNLNRVKDIQIAYETGVDSYIIPKDTIATFFGTDDKGEITYNEGTISEFVKSMASKYNTVGKSKPLHTSYGVDVSVPAGDYGWRVNQDAEIQQLIEDLKGGSDVKRELIYKTKAASHGDQDYGNSYVEINLTAQHMFLYKNGSLVLESDFVSGNPYVGNETHTGAYSVKSCQKDAILRGDNYATPVSYWMPFNGGEGMHDANWRSSFGGQIYKTNGSHGCVNLPVSVAAQVFSNISAGYPVLVYTLGGTENVRQELEAAYAVVELINQIGAVDLSKADYIASVRAQYEALPYAAKQAVTNIGVLQEAEAALAQQQAAAGGGEAPPAA
ncbi:MAG: L,D-transpeptidase/peptidoglycan binding protein [Lachnospiraceae bacterium]|nr:L,D-transpeptidase/peptidoglycan binding protein [Lachnospiraceae bacterium]